MKFTINIVILQLYKNDRMRVLSRTPALFSILSPPYLYDCAGGHLPRLCGRACASHVATTHSIVYRIDRTDTASSRRDPVKAHQLSSRLLGPW
jgi:hypothetical protein